VGADATGAALHPECALIQFFLGTHMPSWLERTSVPLFLSQRRLHHRRTLPRAHGPVAIDSAGYSELSLFGEWRTSPRTYVADVRRYRDEIGMLTWAAVQDWMCEPLVRAKTGKSVLEHQALTIASVLELRSMAPEIPWVPVLQGYVIEDYLEHAEAYARAGIDLLAEPIVGLGTVCRRQATDEAVAICQSVAGLGIRLHGFGIKKLGLIRLNSYLASADSMAWSFDARRKQRPECGSLTHHNCANCLVFALRWRVELLDSISTHALHTRRTMSAHKKRLPNE
jgi:hypothetical protein